MDLHLFHGSLKDFKIGLKRGLLFFFFFSYHIFLLRFGYCFSYSLVQSQSMSPFSLPKWLPSDDEAFHPSGNWKYCLCSMYSCFWLWVKIWENLLLESIDKEHSDSGSAQRAFQVLPSILVRIFSARESKVPQRVGCSLIYGRIPTELQPQLCRDKSRSLWRRSSSYTFTT